MAAEDQPSWIERLLAGTLGSGARGFKFGPGVLATIVPINLVGLPALALIVWSLRGEAILATGALGLGLAFLAYVTERAFRYAEKNPIPALLGGAQLLELLKDSSAKDKTIIYDAKPIEGAGHSVIEGKHRA
jgi:hypothetical protein